MGINIDTVINELHFDERLISAYNTFNKYVDFRFDYFIRTSLSHIPDEINNYSIDYAKFEPNQNILLGAIDSTNDTHDIIKLRDELKTLTTEVNLKRKEINMMLINEEGLKKNIKHLEDIISIKEDFIHETKSFAEIRYNAKQKIEKDFYKTNKKYNKILNQLEKSNKSIKTGSNLNKKQKEYLEQLNEKALLYETKVKKIADLIRIAGDSDKKLMQYQIALQTSKDRLKLFNEQLNNQYETKHDISLLLIEHDKRIDQLKKLLSNLGVFSSIEKSRMRTSSYLILKDDLKKDFLELQNLRNKVLSSRPRGMFNPKYQKENSLTKAEIRRYLENDEVIDSIDYLIELKNNEVGCSTADITNLSKYIKSDTNEASVFLKCILTLSKTDIQKLLIHYFVRVVDMKLSERENDELISKLDSFTDKQKHTIITLNNNYQEFHLSIEKKFTSLKKYYQEKLNSLFDILQEESNALTVYKMKQEISSQKKKILELEKSLSAKPKEIFVMPEPNISLDTSKSGSETLSSAKVSYHKNKVKIKKKSKLF